MIRIAHLYYDLMNLYGENGNVRALIKHFNDQNQEVKVDYLTKGSQIDFDKYDIYYMGMGTENNQLLVLNDLLKQKKEIKKSIASKLWIITGNALELFGKYIKINNKSKVSALGLFDYYTTHIEERIVEEPVMKTSLINYPIIGFQNRQGIIDNIENYWFDVTSGTGINKELKQEGYHQDKFYGTYLVGPLLMRNPYLTDYFVKIILQEKGLEFIEYVDSLEYKAYHEYLKNFIEKVK